MANRNPKYNGRVGVYRTNEIEKYGPICNNALSFPSVANPKLWYKGNGPTASVDTAGYNTVGSTTHYGDVYDSFKRWYDFSVNGYNLSSTTAGGYYEYDPSSTKNGMIYFKSRTAEYMYSTGANVGIAGKGTLILIWRAGTSPSHVWFSKPGSFSLSNGYCTSEYLTTIFGDIQSYSFSNISYNDWNIRVVSVSSAGVPVVYTNNGVQGTTASYSEQVGGGSVPIIAFDNYNQSSLGEFLYWENPLTLSDCNLVEAYLKTKWCLDY